MINIFVLTFRRKLRADVAAAFPSLCADEVSELIPSKEELNVVKIYAHKGDALTLYVLHKNPLFFELEKQLYPTGKKLDVNLANCFELILPIFFFSSVLSFSVYVLWRYPSVLPTFRTWPPVVQKLIGGAGTLLLLRLTPGCFFTRGV